MVENVDDNFGDILKKIISERGWTLSKFCEKANISRMHLYRIINNKNEPSLYILNQMSSALKIDLGEYYRFSKQFQELDEFRNFKLLRELVESEKGIDEIESFFKTIRIENISNGIYRQLVHYIDALIMCKKYKNYTKSLECCYKALDIKNEKAFYINMEKYIISDVAFNIITLIEYNYFCLNRSQEGINLAIKLINNIGKMYFESAIPNINIPNMVIRAYIAMHNNVADYLFNSKEYNESIEYCFKGLDIAKKHNTIYGQEYLFDILFQSYYILEDYVKAFDYYVKARYVCIIGDKIVYLSQMEERVLKKYNKLKEFKENER